MVTLLVATTGGHLTQLVDIARRLPGARTDPRVWVTHDNEQSRSLLAGEQVRFIPYIGVKDVAGVAKSIRHAHRVARETDPTRVVSTGSGIALAFLPYLAAHGVGAHYVESAARVDGPSVSGRLLQRVPRVNVYSQYRHWATGRWRYGGSVFDGFTPVPVAGDPVIERTVVSLGTAQEFPFRRLLDALVPLLGRNGCAERAQGAAVETLWQTGGTPTDGLAIPARPWLAADEMRSAMTAADVVVTHAGTGSALAALEAGRCPVLVPRERARGEAGDDHQNELARSLAERGLAIHRRADELSVSDLRKAASVRVVRLDDPPTFELLA